MRLALIGGWATSWTEQRRVKTVWVTTYNRERSKRPSYQIYVQQPNILLACILYLRVKILKFRKCNSQQNQKLNVNWHIKIHIVRPIRNILHPRTSWEAYRSNLGAVINIIFAQIVGGFLPHLNADIFGGRKDATDAMPIRIPACSGTRAAFDPVWRRWG